MFPYLALAGLLVLLYANTFTSPWNLDDGPNILDNAPLHINNLMPETLRSTLFAQPFAEGHLYRPVANLSFALNWYMGRDNPLGYHLINTLIHLFAAFFLFKSIIFLLHSPSLKEYAEVDVFFIALLSSTLWAINPVQTQAITYIVQRMASMAAMFFIFAIYNYIRARLARTRRQASIRLILCLLFFLLAMGCKENAITLIPSLLLLEVLFFYQKNNRFSKITLTMLVTANLFFVLAAAYYIVDNNLLHFLTRSIGSRPFSLGERLLTEPAILLFYLSLLLYPSSSRLSIDHSFPLSTSLFHPWTTLPALLFTAALLIFAARQWRKRPLLSLAILFFYINQLVESTIIPLELVFEHRNYLPSFFLFLPLAEGLRLALNVCKAKSRVLYGSLLVILPLLLTSISLGTYSRNSVWATEESLWADAMSKAPDNARPLAKLGEIYGWRKEKTPRNIEIAVALLQKSLDKESPRTSFKAAIVDNIGKVYANYGMLDKAIVFYKQSLQLNPDFINSRFDLAEALTLEKNFTQALQEITIVISKNDQQSQFFALKGMILLWLNRPSEAVDCNHRALLLTLVNKERYFYMTGVALGRAGFFSQGLWFLSQALHNDPDNRRIRYSLIENRLLAGDTRAAGKYTLQLLNGYGILTLQNDLEMLPTDSTSVPVNTALITPLLIETAKTALAGLEQAATTPR